MGLKKPKDSIASRFYCAVDVDPRTAGRIVPGATIDQLKAAIERSWGQDTCGCPPGIYAKYMANNPQLGQCVATALVIQDYLGGTLMKERFHLHFDELHLSNVANDGTVVDFTRAQFLRRPYPKGLVLAPPEPTERKKFLKCPGNIWRYTRLREKVDAALEVMLRR